MLSIGPVRDAAGRRQIERNPRDVAWGFVVVLGCSGDELYLVFAFWAQE
jgi:hypothetical protein